MSVLERTLRWIVIAGVFLLPFICLIVTTSLFFPFITGKNFAFRVIVEIVTGAWLALALVFPQYRPRRSSILAAFSIFVLLIAISDAQGANPFKSFWSNFERMDGWVTLIHILALTFVSASMLQAEKLWRRFWQVSLTVSLFVAVYGFLQIAGALALGEGGTSGLSARIDATFGNPIYLAVYMLFHIFIAAMLWMQARVEAKQGVGVWLASWYGGAIVLDTIALLFTGTRGTMLGLIGGAVLAVVIYSFTQSGSARMRRIAVSSVVAVAVAGGGLWLTRDTSFVKNVGFLDRLASISLSDNTTIARLINMQIAMHGVAERPVFGWGQENYAIVFDKYYDPRMYAQEPWFDRVHDIFFDWWIAGGTLGLLAYLSIFAATLMTLWRKASGFSDAEKAILTGLFAGYFCHNLFVFDNITSYILFAMMLGYIVWRASTAARAKHVPESAVLPRSALPIVTLVAIIAVWGAAWYVNAGALAQNRRLLSALTQQKGGILQNLALYKDALSYGALGQQEVREQLTQAATQVAQLQGVDLPTKQQFFDLAVQEMTAQEKVSPLDARFPLFLGIVEGSFGDLSDAAASLQKAHELSPKKQSILFQLGATEQAQGHSADALATYREAYELDTTDTEAQLLYAAEAITAGEESLADQLLQPLIPTGSAADPRIAAAYAGKGEYGKIVTIWAARIKAQPSDAQAYFTLAAAFYAEGDSRDAISTLKAVEQVSSSAVSQAESFITQIQNGTAKVQ